MSKAPSNEGSVYQRASDGKWVAAVTLPSGKRKVAYGDTEKEAIGKRRRMLAEVDAGRPQPVGRTPTLAVFIKRWLEVRIAGEVQAGHLELSTADHYREHVVRFILPAPIARVKLPLLTADDVRAWQRDLLTAPTQRQPKDGTVRLMSPRYVGMAHATLRRALGDAVRDELLTRNVAALVRPPSGQNKPASAPTEDQIAAVFAEMVQDSRRALWLTMLSLGNRKGEALGMRWSLTDLDAASTALHRQIVRQRSEQVDTSTGRRVGRLVEKKTKTAASQASLGLPAALVAVLREHRAEQLRARMAAKVWVDPDLIFTTCVGTALDPRNVNRWWSAICKRAGVTGSFPVHGLRHAAASLAFAAGASMKEVQAMLRHTRQSTTADIYVTVFDSVRRGTADRMDGVLRRLGGAG